MKNKGAWGEWVLIKRNIVFTGIAGGMAEQPAGIGETNGLARLARMMTDAKNTESAITAVVSWGTVKHIKR